MQTIVSRELLNNYHISDKECRDLAHRYFGGEITGVQLQQELKNRLEAVKREKEAQQPLQFEEAQTK